MPELVAEGASLLRLLGGGEVDGEPLLQGGQLVLRRLHRITRTLLSLSNCTESLLLLSNSNLTV